MLVAAALLLQLASALSAPLSDERRATLTAALARHPSASRDGALAGPDPFTRILARNMALGFFDGLGETNLEPSHSFLADERSALADEAQDSFRAWRISLLVGAGGTTVGLLVLAVVVGRDMRLRSANSKALHLLAGSVKPQGNDPDMRALLLAIAQLEDPDVARRIR